MNKNQLLKELYCISKEYSTKKDAIRKDQDTFLSWCEKQIKTHFAESFIQGQVNQATNHLALYLLGDEDNNFDKLINPTAF
jgi:hypothetical protein